ncbi:hypothetical protein CRG98_037175 [Punica granatum]|uniref:Uncharacterized protein n=1 Tax=Punica granatum TaxID=22663 RepID=A0A2I0IEK7_PUNGR|nr:hypothetical protein CRG98_037175 [Punica granatum]
MAIDFRRSGRRSCSWVNSIPITSSSARRSASLCERMPACSSARARAQYSSPCAHALAPRTSLRVHACTSTLQHVRLPHTLVTSTRPIELLAARLSSCNARACQRTPSRVPLLARTYITLHPNVLSSVQPSHPTLKLFPDSFLASRG